MKRNFFLLVATFALLFVSSSSAFPTKRTDRAIKSVLQEFQAVGISVAIVKDRKIVYNKSFGCKDLESKAPLRNEHLMRIASISKSFTATGLMQLVEQGKISLDSDVSDLIGFKVRNPRFPNTPITLKMILSHTSSIGNKGNYSTLDRINPAISGDCAEAYLEKEPGTHYCYSNLGLNLAGAILEKVSGVRFDEYIKRNVIEPLGLYGSFNVDALDASRFASLYRYNKSKGEFVKSVNAYKSTADKMPSYVLGYSAPLFSPTGGMKITAHDLAVYMMMHMNYGEYNGVRIISEKSSKTMQTPVWTGKARYGLCLKEYTNYINDERCKGEGRTPIGHSGSAYGLKSIMIWSPADGWGVVAMISGYASNRKKDIVKTLVNAIYEVGLKE
jgi:CubicO group peptidase (beta-lactamase class C family)